MTSLAKNNVPRVGAAGWARTAAVHARLPHYSDRAQRAVVPRRRMWTLVVSSGFGRTDQRSIRTRGNAVCTRLRSSLRKTEDDEDMYVDLDESEDMIVNADFDEDDEDMMEDSLEEEEEMDSEFEDEEGPPAEEEPVQGKEEPVAEEKETQTEESPEALSTECPPGFVLNFLWMEKLIAISVDQVYNKRQRSPLTEYFVWPRSDAWEELRVRLSENTWIDQTARVLLLNRATEVINYWQDEETSHTLADAREQFPDCVFMGSRTD